MVPRLIPNWRLSWRFTSVQAAALLAVLSAVQAELLPTFEAAVPAQYWPYVTAAFGVAIALLRILAQPSLEQPNYLSTLPPDGEAEGGAER